jgi:poly(hydroxyalkanoate) granule-associated protein
MVTKVKKSAAAEPIAPVTEPMAEPVTKPSSKRAGKSAKASSAKTAPERAKGSAVLTDSVKDSAQQIWQAGLGAFTRAQVEGTKAFEALVKEGVKFQRKTQSAAEEKINEAAQKMTSMASDITARASGQWDKLESIFEDRVAKALGKLGVPSAKEVADLVEQINRLNDSVQQLMGAQAPAAPASAKATKRTRKATVTPDAEAVAEPVEEAAAEPAPAEPASAKPVRKPAARKAPARKAAAPAPEENPQA